MNGRMEFDRVLLLVCWEYLDDRRDGRPIVGRYEFRIMRLQPHHLSELFITSILVNDI